MPYSWKAVSFLHFISGQDIEIKYIEMNGTFLCFCCMMIYHSFVAWVAVIIIFSSLKEKNDVKNIRRRRKMKKKITENSDHKEQQIAWQKHSTIQLNWYHTQIWFNFHGARKRTANTFISLKLTIDNLFSRILRDSHVRIIFVVGDFLYVRGWVGIEVGVSLWWQS